MTNIVYREISPADYAEYARICAVAYNMNAEQVATGLVAGRDGLPRGIYCGDRLVTGGILVPLQVMAGGATLAGGGIAMVATPPEARRRGYTAALLRGLVDEMRAGGASISTPGAFKESFYGRYGWVSSMEFRRLSGPPRLFASFRRRTGSWVPCGQEAIPEVDVIYRSAMAGRFGPLERDAAWWEYRVLHHGNRHLYIWRDDTGTARAYVIFRFENESKGQTVVCREVVALDPEALGQVFGFFSMFEDQAEEVRFKAPADLPIQLLLPDSLECRMEPSTTMRLLDVIGVLTGLRYPEDVSGRLVLRIADDWLAHNRGIFKLEIDAGHAICRQLPDDAPVDLACDVRQLGQIVSRYLRPKTAAAFGLLDVHNPAALALFDQIFAGPSPYVSDWF